MSYKELVQSVMPMAIEIMSECIKMPDEVYQEYKEEMKQYIDDLNTPWICSFFGEVFSIIEEYRQRDERKEAAF